MSFLGDVMINFWYEDIVAEAQLVYYGELEKKDEPNNADHEMKIPEKLDHFLYEIKRNPLGPLVHCAELLYKYAQNKGI